MTKHICSLPRLARYDASPSNAAPRQGTQIPEQLEEGEIGDEEKGEEGEEGEEEEDEEEEGEQEEEEREKYEEDKHFENSNVYFAESDSEFEVDPDSEANWQSLLQVDITRNDGYNQKGLVPRTDGEFTHRYAMLKKGICDWAFKYFYFTRGERFQLDKLREEHELVSYIDSIAAVSSPNLAWVDVIETMTPRLVMGILMKAIQSLIFGEPIFGASAAQKKILNDIDKRRIKENQKCIPTPNPTPYPLHSPSFLLSPLSSLLSPLPSLLSPLSSLLSPLGAYFLLISFLAEHPSIFKRQKIRASMIDSLYPGPSELPHALHSNILLHMTALAFLLRPLGTGLGGRANRHVHSLGYLLLEAARLHFDMRREPDTVYYIHSPEPGDLVNDHTQCDVPTLETYNKPEKGDPKQRIHIVLAPGIIALRKFGHQAHWQYRTRVVADVIAVPEWVNDDQKNRAPKLSQTWG